MKRRSFVVGASALGIASVAARSVLDRPEPAVRAPTRGGTLVVLLGGEPSLLVSAFDSTMTNGMIGSKVLEGLVTYDVDLKPKPALAESWEVSPDGLGIRLNLRRGVAWHDGRPFTSSDVVFTLQEAWSKLHPFGRAVYRNVEKVEAPDAHSVVLQLSAPAQYLFAYLNSYGSQVLPRHVYEGRDVRTNPANHAPIGTGPFRFVEWVRGSHVRLEKNPSYWRAGQPYLDSVVFRFIPDAAARAAALQSGEAQLALGNSIPYLSLRRFIDNPRFTINTDDGRFLASLGLLVVNVRKAPLSDRRVRQAFMHSVDREALIRLVLRGQAKIATGPIPSAVKRYYTDEVPKYPYDLARAKQLLDAAGLRPGADGVRLRLNLETSGGEGDRDRMAQFLKQSFAKAGIALQVRKRDHLGFLRQIFTEQDYDIASTGLHMLPDPTLGVQRLYWTKNIQKGVPWTNGSGYSNPELDAVMEAAQVEGDEARRKALMVRWQRIVQEDLPVLNLTETQWVTVASARLRRPTLQGDGLFDTLGDAHFVA